MSAMTVGAIARMAGAAVAARPGLSVLTLGGPWGLRLASGREARCLVPACLFRGGADPAVLKAVATTGAVARVSLIPAGAAGVARPGLVRFRDDLGAERMMTVVLGECSGPDATEATDMLMLFIVVLVTMMAFAGVKAVA